MSERMERISAMKTAAMRCMGCQDRLIEATQLLYEGAGLGGKSECVRKVVAAYDAVEEAINVIQKDMEWVVDDD